MATSGTYFIDTTTFTTATSVWLNASLTILAPDGFYAIDGVYRQQVSGVLLEEIQCNPTPTPTPTPTPNCEFDVDVDNITTPTPTPTPTSTPTPTPNCEFDVNVDNITTPTPTPTPTSTPTPTPICEFDVDVNNITTPTPTPTPTSTPTPTPNCEFDVDVDNITTPTPTPTPTSTPTPTPICEFDVDVDNITTPTPTPTSTPTPTPTPNCEFDVDVNNITTPTPTPAPTNTPTPTPTPTNTPTPTPTVIVFNTINTSPTCYGGSDGSIQVYNVSGGSGVYTYSKNGVNYQAGTTFTNLSSGSYTIYVKDSNGFVGTSGVSLSRTVVTATVSQTNLDCYGGSNGSIVISNVSGGQGGPYATKLNNGGTYQVISTSRTYSSLTAGAYVVYVKDTAGCEVTYPITITQPTIQGATITVNTYATCNGSADGEITLSSSGGTFPKTYRLYADTTAPYTTCGDLIGTYTNVTSGSPSVSVTGIDEFGYCLEVTDTNGCVTSSGVVETSSCSGTCYTISIPPSMLTYNGETLYIMYRKTDTTYVSEPYGSFPIGFEPDNDDYIINICSTQYPTFKYGNSGIGVMDGTIEVIANGICDNSEWCGGADPYIPPPPTPTPSTGSYFCKENEYSPCIEQVVPCVGNQIECGGGFEQIQ